MKKVLRIVLIILVVAIIIVGGVALYINVKGIPHYKAEKIDYTAHPTPEKLARGKKLASMLCAGCHLNKKTGKLTGRPMKDAAQFGTIYSQNITQDKEYGIGDWTDGEILYLLRTGIKRDGSYAPPYMAKLPHMADEDIESIIAFLRSDDPMVQPAAVPDKPCEPNFLAKALSNFVFKPLPFPDKPIPLPDTTNKVEWGKYLAFNLDCYSCHSASFDKVNIMEPEKSEGFFGGGNPIPNNEGKIIHSANLTPSKTGIGDWTEDQFIRAVKFGLVKGQEALRYPMVPLPQMTDKEAAAIFAYLQTIPPIDNKVDRGL